jgi:hypothetical protein
LFERVAPPTLGIIRRLVAQRAMAEDLLQDTLIAMFEHLDDFRGEAPFGIWVRSIAVSRCLMAFRFALASGAALRSSHGPKTAGAAGESTSRTSDLIDLDRALANSRRSPALSCGCTTSRAGRTTKSRAPSTLGEFFPSRSWRAVMRGCGTELLAPMNAALASPAEE